MATQRIGLTVSWEQGSVEATVRYAQLAEACGYEAFFLPEAWGRDAWVLLGHVAARTERIALGTGIVNVYSRSAAVLAMAAATLDEASGGRAMLGLGTSGKGVVEGWHGIPMEKPMARLRDYTAVVRKVLRQDRTRYEGATISQAPGFALRFTPTRRSVPIYLASVTPAGIRLAGEIADGWFPFLASPESMQSEIDELQKGLALSGRGREAITVAPYVVCNVDDDPDAARRPARQMLAFYLGGMGRFYHETISRHGFGTAADRVRELWAAGQREAAMAAVPDALVDAVSACGPAVRCRSRLDEYRRSGADLPVVSIPASMPQAQAEAVIRALAPQ